MYLKISPGNQFQIGDMYSILFIVLVLSRYDL